jgi:glycosyltransferase involved in cell wall biosynthesis
VIVHQVLSGAGPFDAITQEALAFRELFTQWGWGGTDAAVSIDPRIAGRVVPLARLAPGPRDVLLIHYSAYAPRLRGLLDLPNPRLLLSHNITPARWLWGHEPMVAVQCALGREQLPAFVAGCDAAAGDSAYNAAELAAAGARDPGVIPILVHPQRLGEPQTGAAPPAPPTILFVGRLMPHKRQDEVLRVFAAFRRHHEPDARLVLVGEPVTPAYGRAIAELADQLAPGAVTIEGGITRERLAERYRQAHAFLCLSEHEGFCVPVLEALHFGVPVVARPAGAVPEVARDAALLVSDEDPAVVCELLALAVDDVELRAELRRRGAARVAHFAPERTAAALRSALEPLAGLERGQPVAAGA